MKGATVAQAERSELIIERETFECSARMLPEAQPYFERAVAGSTTVLIAAHPASKNVAQWTKINLAAL